MKSKKNEIIRIRRQIAKVRQLTGVECGYDGAIAETDKAVVALVKSVLDAMAAAHLAGWSRIPWEGWK